MTDKTPMIVRELIAMQNAAHGATCKTCKHLTTNTKREGRCDEGRMVSNWYVCKLTGEPVADNGCCVNHEWSRDARVRRAVKSWVE